MENTNQQQNFNQIISRLVLENNVPCFINEGGNLMLVLPNGEKINPLFTDKLYWLKRVAYALGISPLKVEKLVEQQRGGNNNPQGNTESTKRKYKKTGSGEVVVKEVPKMEERVQRVDIFKKLEEA
jgi:hypothetical protein